MGNCFGKTSDKSFQGEGRTLGASPAKVPPPTQSQGASAAVPRIAPPQGGRTLGKNSQDGSQAPGAAAAKAAEERVKASQGKGKLGKQLDAQKSQSQTGTLAQTARDNVAARDADAAAQARNWN